MKNSYKNKYSRRDRKRHKKRHGMRVHNRQAKVFLNNEEHKQQPTPRSSKGKTLL